MTIHEMMQQVALLSGGAYRRQGGTSAVDIPLPGGRKQTLYACLEYFETIPVGLFYAKVGPAGSRIDPMQLLALNTRLRYSRVAIMEGETLALQAMVELERTSVKECAPVLQEIGAVADELERLYYGEDVS